MLIKRNTDGYITIRQNIFQYNDITRNKEEHFIMIEVNLRGKAILNICASNTELPYI